MKTYIGSRGTDPLILNIGDGWRSVANFTPGPIYFQNGTPLLIVQDPGMAPQTVWKFCRKEKKFLTSPGTRTPESPFPSLFTILTTLPGVHVL